jgi:hypothetical protein
VQPYLLLRPSLSTSVSLTSAHRVVDKDILNASRKQEKRTADTYRGSRNLASGAGWLRKNDVRAEHFLIENKLTTNARSYSIKFTDLRDLQQRAIMEDRMPLLQFDLGGKRYVILTEDDFLEIIDV